MKLLLDTHVLLWAAGQPRRLSAAARRLLSSPEHELLFSAASFWEITIKRALEREDFRVDPRVLKSGLLDNGYAELPVTSSHAMAVEQLPLLHRDPFDRLLLAQAHIEGVSLVTADEAVARYPGSVIRV